MEQLPFLFLTLAAAFLPRATLHAVTARVVALAPSRPRGQIGNGSQRSKSTVAALRLGLFIGMRTVGSRPRLLAATASRLGV